MENIIDIEECVVLAHDLACGIQNALIKNNWTGEIIQRTRRQQYEKLFLHFLVQGPSQYSFRKNIVSNTHDYVIVVLERHEIQKKGKDNNAFRQLCDQTCSKIEASQLQKMMLERLSDMEENYQVLLQGELGVDAETGSKPSIMDKRTLRPFRAQEQAEQVAVAFKKS